MEGRTFHMSTRSYSAPEPLEARIAPAAMVTIAVGAHNVVVKSSLGTNDDLMAALGTQMVLGDTLLLPAIDLADHPIFKGSDFSIVPDAGASVRVGDLNATGLNLGTVIIGGDVDQIEAGSSSHPGTAIKSLHIASLNEFTTATVANPGTSTIFGGINTLTVDGDFDGAFFLNSAKGSIKAATIGGNFVGGASQDFGTLSVAGTIGSITVTGGLIGGMGSDSGSIEAHGTITKALIGSITGGVGLFSGQLMSQANITAVTVTGAITGSTDVNSGAHNGQVFAQGKINTATIGSLVGGAGSLSGTLTSGAGIGKVTVGAVGNTTTTVIAGGAGTESGSIGTGGSIKTVTVNGSITGGSGDNSGDIQAVGTIGTVTVHGTVTGGSGTQSGAIGSNGALSKVAIDGGLMGGSGTSSGEVVSATSLGSVTIGTSTVMANVVGGGSDQSGSIGSLGKVGSVTITGSLEGGDGFQSGVIISAKSIGTVKIGGSVLGTTDAVVGGSDASILAPIISSVSITGSLDGGTGQQSGQISGTQIGSVHIGGSIMGGSGNQSGEIRALIGTIGKETVGGTIGDVTVGSSIVAGTANGSGSIISFGSIKSVTVTGSVNASNSVAGTDNAGSILTINVEDPFNHQIGSVVVKGSVIGGAGDGSGAIESGAGIGSVTVGQFSTRPTIIVAAADPGVNFGDLRGGTGSFSGAISALDTIGKVEIFGSLIGNNTNSGVIEAGSLPSILIHTNFNGGNGQFAGSIQASEIGKVTIDGNINGGTGDHSASILALDTLTSLTVLGDIVALDTDAGGTGIYISGGRHIGSITATDISGSPGAEVIIASQGLATAKTQAQAVAIDKITVLQTMAFTEVLAGYDQNGNAANGHVSIGTILLDTQGGDTVGTNNNTFLAGAMPDATDFYIDIAGGNPQIESQIAKIVINGGTENHSTIVADHLLSVSLVGSSISLTSGPHNDAQFSPALGLYEVGAPISA